MAISNYMFLSRAPKIAESEKNTYLVSTGLLEDARAMGDVDIRFGVVNSRKRNFRDRHLDHEKEIFLV